MNETQLLAELAYIITSINYINYIGGGLRDAFDPYKVLETVGEYT